MSTASFVLLVLALPALPASRAERVWWDNAYCGDVLPTESVPRWTKHGNPTAACGHGILSLAGPGEWDGFGLEGPSDALPVNTRGITLEARFRVTGPTGRITVFKPNQWPLNMQRHPDTLVLLFGQAGNVGRARASLDWNVVRLLYSPSGAARAYVMGAGKSEWDAASAIPAVRDWQGYGNDKPPTLLVTGEMKIDYIRWTHKGLFAPHSTVAISLPSPDDVPKKLVAFCSRSMPADAVFGEKIREMERICPYFDGLRLEPRLRAEGLPDWAGWWKGVFSFHFFGAHRITWDQVEQGVEHLRRGRPKIYRHNFIRACAQPGDVDWFSSGWSGILHNAELLGRIVRETGFRGIWFDPEHYRGRPFSYEGQHFRHRFTFAQYADQVQKRGREFIRAINREAPDVHIILSWAHKYYESYEARHPGLSAADLSPGGYLLGPFLDGMMEAATPETLFFDGDEQAYGVRDPLQFKARRLRTRMARRFSRVPEIYDEKMKVAFGLEIDRLYPVKGGFYPNEPERNYWTPEQLTAAIAAAMEQSDGYVWLWSETIDWFAGRMVRGKTNGQTLGDTYPDALRQARAWVGKDRAGLKVDMTRGGVLPEELRKTTEEEHFAPLWMTHRLLADIPRTASFHIATKELLAGDRWAQPDFDEEGWHPIRVDSFWDNQGYSPHEDHGLYRLRFTAPADLPGMVLLSFGAADDSAEIWLNGRRLGFYDQSWMAHFEMDASGAVRAGAENLLAVKIGNVHGLGGLWGPIKLVTPK